MRCKISKKMNVCICLVLIFTMIFSVNMTGTRVKAATLISGGDYQVTVNEVSDSECNVVFVPQQTAAYVIIHYTVNGGTQMNMTMSNNGSNWTAKIKNMSKNDTILCSFTYEKGGLQYDTATVSYVFGNPSTSTGSGNQSNPDTTVDNEGTGSGNSGTTSGGQTGNTQVGQDIPVLRSDIPVRNDAMFLQLNNKTNGAFSNNEIYWCILGYDPKTNQLCYVDKSGKLIPATTDLNTISKGDRKFANICYTLAEADYVYMPDITSGRMYLSYGSPVYITINKDINGNMGYAGPDLNNTSDPNRDVYFEFLEFTISNKVYWGNTTRVDNYCFPTVSRLVGDNGFINTPGDCDHYDLTVGDIGTREETFAAFAKEVPSEFQSLIRDQYRIVAPCKGSFNEGSVNANYFESAINAFWDKYSKEELVFTCDAGTFHGRVSGNTLNFTKDDGRSGSIQKPNTQEVLEGKGVLAAGTDIEKVVEAQLCAAFNRGIALQPEKWGTASAYYTSSPCNYYAKFWHEHSFNQLAYGFCYDDVFDQSTLLHYSNPTALVIDLKW